MNKINVNVSQIKNKISANINNVTNVNPSKGVLFINKNGEYNVKNYEFANVNIRFNDNLQKKIDATNSVESLFAGTKENTDLNFFKDYDTSKVTNFRSFMEDSKGDWDFVIDTSKAEYMESAFSDAKTPETITFTSTNELSYASYLFLRCTNLKRVINFEPLHCSSLDYIFCGCTNLEECEIHYIDNTSPRLSSAFAGCTNLKKVTLNLENANIDSSSSMFSNCVNLEQINSNIKNLEQIKSSNMAHMFDNCSKIKKLPNIYINTSNNLGFYHVFYGCTSLEEIIFDYYNVSSMASGYGENFKDCTSLKRIVIKEMGTGYKVGKNSFLNTPSYLKIYVPDEKVEILKITDYWVDVADKIYPLSLYEGD